MQQKKMKKKVDEMIWKYDFHSLGFLIKFYLPLWIGLTVSEFSFGPISKTLEWLLLPKDPLTHLFSLLCQLLCQQWSKRIYTHMVTNSLHSFSNQVAPVDLENYGIRFYHEKLSLLISMPVSLIFIYFFVIFSHVVTHISLIRMAVHLNFCYYYKSSLYKGD